MRRSILEKRSIAVVTEPEAVPTSSRAGRVRLPKLIAPEGSVGAVASVLNFINTLFGLAAPIVTGYLVQATGKFSAPHS